MGTRLGGGLHSVIFRVADDCRRHQHTLVLAIGCTWADVTAALAASYGRSAEEIHIVVISPVADGMTRAPGLPSDQFDGTEEMYISGEPAKALPTRIKRRKLVSTDTPPEQWPRDLTYLDTLINRIYDRRSRARKRQDQQLADLMDDRLKRARALRAEIVLEVAVTRPEG